MLTSMKLVVLQQVARQRAGGQVLHGAIITRTLREAGESFE